MNQLPNPQPVLLEVADLYADIGQFQILQGVSFSVPENRVTVLLGRNGAGKTTTLQTIMGFHSVRGGNITWQGQSLVGLAPYQIAGLGIGYVPEDGNIFTNLTIAENLELSFAGRKMGAKKLAAPSIEEVLDIFPDLRAAWKRPAGTLSGGQRQMLAIASALVTEPPLLLIDEPSKGLSPLFVQTLGKVLQSIRTRTTILLVEQNFSLATAVADTHVILEEGRSVHHGEMADLVQSPDLQGRYLGLHVAGGAM